LRSLVISSATRAVIAAVAKVRACLAAKGLHALGGAELPPGGSSSPDGELIVSGAFIAFYTDAAKARRLEPSVVRNAGRGGWQVERRGDVTVLWIRPPSTARRQALETCAFA
jgi:hypothetical protein